MTECSCARHWSTTRLATEKGLSWRYASAADANPLKDFLEAGGTGNPSIDKFVSEDLIRFAADRYSNTFLLVAGDGKVVGFVSNAMGQAEMTGADLMGQNMSVVPTIPVLFLHRIGVLKGYQRKSLGTLLVWRVFETLAHSCTHSAAAAIALWVDPLNSAAVAMYQMLDFQRSEQKKRRTPGDLYFLPYPAAVNQIPR